jgi:hypothetical protein
VPPRNSRLLAGEHSVRTVVEDDPAENIVIEDVLSRLPDPSQATATRNGNPSADVPVDVAPDSDTNQVERTRVPKVPDPPDPEHKDQPHKGGVVKPARKRVQRRTAKPKQLPNLPGAHTVLKGVLALALIGVMIFAITTLHGAVGMIVLGIAAIAWVLTVASLFSVNLPDKRGGFALLVKNVAQPSGSFIWKYFKKAGRFIGDHTTFGQYRKPPTWNSPRRWIYQLTGGRWNFGRSAEERRKTDIESIRHTESTNSTVIVFYSKAAGGVGKTTGAVSLAQGAAEDLPNISVLLAEINPQGSVKDATGVKREDIPCVRLAQKETDPIKKQLLMDEACFTVLEAIGKLNKLQSMQDVLFRFPTMPGTGVYVLTHPEATRIDPRDLRRFVAAMRRIFPRSIWDLDQYDSHADTALMLELADVAMVPATRRNKARGRQAGEALWDLKTKYHTRSVLVINRVWFNWFHRSTTRNVRKIQELLKNENHTPYTGPVGTLPWNFWIALGGRFLLRSRSTWFKRHVRELAALACEEARKAHFDKSNSSANTD